MIKRDTLNRTRIVQARGPRMKENNDKIIRLIRAKIALYQLKNLFMFIQVPASQMFGISLSTTLKEYPEFQMTMGGWATEIHYRTCNST